MTQRFKNNASTTLSGSINNSQTSITVVSSGNFPVLAGADYFYATMYEVSGAVDVNIEIVKVTATSGNVWTILRGQDGTSARSRDGVTACYIEQRMTAAAAQEMLQIGNDLSDLASASNARTNLGLGSMATQSASAVAITGGTISGVTINTIDSSTTIADNVDNTKKLAFEVSGVATGVTRTLTIPNASGTIALTSDLTAGYQPLDSDLTALAAMSANGLLARTGTGAFSVRTIAMPAAGLTITNGDGVAGNPTVALSNDLAAVEALATTGFVRRTATDTWSASAIADGDLPSALTGKTYNALALTANATGFSVAGGTTSKTLTISNSMTLAGTDGTTITLPTTSGTVALNNQTVYLGTTGIAINRGSGALSLAGVSIDGSAGSASTATSATTATNIASGALGSVPYQSAAGATALLAPNTTATKNFLAQTGTGTVGAAPVWTTLTKSDVGLGSVENTALSTWTGSSTITTVGTIATGTWQGTAVGISYGGTGATTKAAGFNALSPVTTLGDVIYGDGTNSNTRLAGNTTTTRKFIRQTGNGTVSAAPAWDTLVDGDIPTALTGKTYNALTLTAAATGFTIAGGTTSKTLTVSNTLALAGTDSSTLNIGSGGTLGSAAFTASTAYAPAAGSASINTVGTITSGTWTGSAIGISYGGTGQTSKTAAFDALSPLTTLGDLIYSDGTDNVRLAGNTTTGKRFLTQTGTGTVSAAPGWNAIVDGDIPSALTGKTYNALTLTANATGFQIAGGTTAKTLVVSNNLTLAGTDGSTLNIGAGGTLGSAAFVASSTFAPAAGSSSITTVGTIASGTWTGSAIGIAYGGTGQATKAAGFNALSPVTTLGDLIYGDGANSNSRLAGNTTTAKQFLTQTGNGTVSAAPVWGALANADIPSALTGKTYNALSLTANAAGFSVAGGTTSKTLTVNNNLTFSGTDGSTLNIGSGGTLGTAAYTNSTAYASTGANSFTGSQQIQGNLTFDGLLRRILADFSNVTGSSRTAFQSSTTDGGTTVNAIPNGAGNFANFAIFDSSDADNAGYGYIGINATDVRINTNKTGTGTVKPLKIYTNSTERLEFSVTGAWGLAGANYGTAGQVLISQGASASPAWGAPPVSFTLAQAHAVALSF